MNLQCLNPVVWWRGFLRLLRETPIEIFIGVVIGILIAVFFSYRYEQQREWKSPLAFAEISQLEDAADATGAGLGPFSTYLSYTNDCSMKVLECYFDAKSKTFFGSYHRFFAIELNARIQDSYKIYRHDLKEILGRLPGISDTALVEFSSFVKVRDRMAYVNKAFDKSWVDTHIDHYRSQIETYTDADGNLQTRIVQVYDHTTHSYDYHKNYGEEASRLIDLVLTDFPQLRLTEQIRLAARVGDKNALAMEKSQKHKKEQKRFTENELLQKANTWWFGSTLNINLPIIYSRWEALHQDAALWRVAKLKAQDHCYNTGSSFDSGPREFQVAETALSNGIKLNDAINQIIEGVLFTKNKSTELSNLINEYIDVVLEFKKGNPNKLAKQIISTAREIYIKNYKKGFDINPFRVQMIVLWAFLGAIAGGLLGFVWDRKFFLFRDTTNYY